MAMSLSVCLHVANHACHIKAYNASAVSKPSFLYKYKVRLVKLPGYPMPLLLFVAFILQCRERADLASNECNKHAQNHEPLMKFSQRPCL